jgi:hypothetical protein
MSDRRRNAEIHHLEKLLRKARRRGDAAEVVRWSRAIDLRFLTRARVDLAVERRFKAERELQDFEDMKEELERLRNYVAWHPRAAPAKADV